MVARIGHTITLHVYWISLSYLHIIIITYFTSLTNFFQSGGKSATVERLTDTSRYTGAHKQRFDESGKGKGIAGRKDVPDSSGYVQGYQNKDSYSKNH